VEGAGGPLTGLDPEESPLSIVRTAREIRVSGRAGTAAETNGSGCVQ